MPQADVIVRGMSQAAHASSGETPASEEIRAFLQRRVASFALLLTAVFSVFFTWRVLVTVFDGATRAPSSTYLLPQGGSVAVFLAMWLLLRGRPRSMRVIQAAELGGLTVGCALALVMGLFIPYIGRPDFTLAFAFTLILVTRAIYVPSRASTTLVLGGLIGVALLLASYTIHVRGHDPSIYTDTAPSVMRDSPHDTALRSTLVIALWWCAAVALAAAASKVIYGLREQVRDARRLGQYTLLEKVGQGGMGEVYRASHAMLRRPTAVKLLPPDKIGEESIARFEREVQLTARLTHPNTVRIFDYGRTPDRVFYYAMEFLDGASLAEVVAAAGPMPAARVIHVLEQCAGALAEAHGVGLIHRDVKPANILLCDQGGVPDVAKVVDFGLVKDLGGAATGEGEAATLQAITRDDTVAGTPHYMAPETITGVPVDARADIYALGAVGYFLLTGGDVFTGRTVLEICSHHLQTPPEPPSLRLGRPVPADLEALILRCLEKDPAARPASARALRDALHACADAGGWSEDEARAWWAEHGAAVRGGRPRERERATDRVGTASTMAVDLGAQRRSSL